GKQTGIAIVLADTVLLFPHPKVGNRQVFADDAEEIGIEEAPVLDDGVFNPLEPLRCFFTLAEQQEVVGLFGFQNSSASKVERLLDISDVSGQIGIRALFKKLAVGVFPE